MITYEQVGDAAPKDVQVTTDDGNAELSALQEAFEGAELIDAETFANLTACQADEDGEFVFIIPGHEVGEVSDILEPELGLEDAVDEWNRAALDEAERIAKHTDE